jgi:hypothetical protein
MKDTEILKGRNGTRMTLKERIRADRNFSRVQEKNKEKIFHAKVAMSAKKRFFRVREVKKYGVRSMVY